MLLAQSPTAQSLDWLDLLGLVGVIATFVGVVLALIALRGTREQVRLAKDAADNAHAASDNALEAATAAKEFAAGAKSASEAARDAALATRRELSTKQALMLVPRLRYVANQLDQAIEESDEKWIRRHLESWRWEVSHIHGLIRQEDPKPQTLLRELAASASLAGVASGHPTEGKPLVTNPVEAREAISIACTSLATWAGQRSAEVGN